ncbi:MAG: bifunctional metallophosphatase/5'-nucleotidase [Clostridia bacterium]|nr:bifunctional metallophosphatase/5'-nucleotidase [Clostridia bacterium]
MKKLTNLIVTIILTLSILLCCGCTDENTNSQLSDNSVIYNEDGSLVEDTSKGDSSIGDREEQDNEQNDNQSNNQQGSGSGDNNQSSAASGDTGCKKHKDSNKDEICDVCKKSVIVYVDFYNINDLHGKLDDGDGHIGVDELTTYLKNARKTDDHSFFISSGDMWQGQAESNMTKGIIMTDWMNELDFTAMAIGNHEYDWGGEYIKQNADFAEFPFLAINIYDRATNKLVDYCKPSVMVDAGAVQIGFIGAIGDCYSSIAVDKCDDVYFKVGSQLTSLVKAEADELRHNGADYIVYILHDGYGSSNYGSTTQISSSQIRSYYDVALSDGYVDLVFEGHTHQGYRLIDEHGVYHIQNRGDNKGGISHAEVAINSVTNESEITEAELVSTSQYQNLNDDPIVDKLLEKYKDQISAANEVLGYNRTYRDDEELEQLVAKLYYEVGVKEWGNKYKIVLGGGFLRTRSPYNLYAGDVTYGQLSSLFTFDNQITLCAVKGRDLKRKFFETNHSDYFISYGDYGNSVRNNIDLNATYYIVVDNYTADYSYNNLTIVERYDPNVFARDLLADYIKKGGLS